MFFSFGDRQSASLFLERELHTLYMHTPLAAFSCFLLSFFFFCWLQCFTVYLYVFCVLCSAFWPQAGRPAPFSPRTCFRDSDQVCSACSSPAAGAPPLKDDNLKNEKGW